MYIQNNLSDEDMGRGAALAPNPVPATLIAGSYLAQLEAIDIFVDDYVTPVARGIIAPQPRENVLSGLFYRALGFCKSAIELKSFVHHGTLVSAERSVIELYVDMELMVRNEIPDAVGRFFAWTNWQKLKAARRTDRFFTDNPGRDQSKAATRRAFIAASGAAIETEVIRLWGAKANGAPNAPEHWSGMDLPSRGHRLGVDIEYMVVKDYDRRNFAVHTGLAGMLNMQQAQFEAMCAFALRQIGECMLAAVKVLCAELHMNQAIANFDNKLLVLDEVQSYTFIDKVLMANGEQSRYVIFRGDPPIVAVVNQ